MCQNLLIEGGVTSTLEYNELKFFSKLSLLYTKWRIIML
jgi:hypothetical protein